MKKTFLLTVLFMLSCVQQISAITRVVNISELEGELTRALREQVLGLTYNDTIVINFDKVGCDTIRGTVLAQCNVVMKGMGRCKSTIVLDNGVNQEGFIAFTNDSFFVFRGFLSHNISVTITDLSFKLKDHSGIWWDSSEKHAVKIYHANEVIINNVDSYLKNAVCTNFDLRVCSNVTVSNCNIVNYNNCMTGGCLWLRGEMHNITVTGNKFYKYGNDESLAFFSHLLDANTNQKGNVTRSNINISDNDFYYGYDGEDKNVLFNDMQISLYSGDSQYTCTTNDFLFSKNRFHNNDLINRTIFIGFNDIDSFESIEFNDNTIIDNYFGSIKRYYRNDIEINDNSSHPDTIYFKNNILMNYNPVVNPYGDNGAAYFLLNGGKICIDGNVFFNTVTTDTAATADIGVTLIWDKRGYGDVTMRNNTCHNIRNIAKVAASSGVTYLKMHANNNIFKGDTRIYCNLVDSLDLDFRKNLFLSNKGCFFLQEFARSGNVVFNENNVFVETAWGRLMDHWGSNPTSEMHFERLEVKNNLLRGINSIEDMLINITNYNERIVSGNINILNH